MKIKTILTMVSFLIMFILAIKYATIIENEEQQIMNQHCNKLGYDEKRITERPILNTKSFKCVKMNERGEYEYSKEMDYEWVKQNGK